MSDGRIFFDTNMHLYAYSRADRRKQARAQQLLTEHADSGRLLVSTQVVQEFYVAGLRKLNIPRQELQAIAATLLDLPLIVIGPSHILEAIRTSDRYQIPFWDALILAAAESGHASLLYTEDLNHGQQYGSVRVENPFLE